MHAISGNSGAGDSGRPPHRRYPLRYCSPTIIISAWQSSVLAAPRHRPRRPASVRPPTIWIVSVVCRYSLCEATHLTKSSPTPLQFFPSPALPRIPATPRRCRRDHPDCPKRAGRSHQLQSYFEALVRFHARPICALVVLPLALWSHTGSVLGPREGKAHDPHSYRRKPPLHPQARPRCHT